MLVDDLAVLAQHCKRSFNCFWIETSGRVDTLTKSRDGSIYSDLYKDVYGSRPRGATFASVEEFDNDFTRLSKRLDEQLDEVANRMCWDAVLPPSRTWAGKACAARLP